MTTAEGKAMVYLGITDESREETQLEDQNNVRPKF